MIRQHYQAVRILKRQLPLQAQQLGSKSWCHHHLHHKDHSSGSIVPLRIRTKSVSIPTNAILLVNVSKTSVLTSSCEQYCCTPRDLYEKQLMQSYISNVWKMWGRGPTFGDRKYSDSEICIAPLSENIGNIGKLFEKEEVHPWGISRRMGRICN